MPRPDAGSKPVAVRQGDRGSKATSYTKNLRRDAARRHSSYLISFIFSLDHEAQSLQEAVIKHGLAAFPVFASTELASTPSSFGVPCATISVSLPGSGRCSAHPWCPHTGSQQSTYPTRNSRQQLRRPRKSCRLIFPARQGSDATKNQRQLADQHA